MLVAFLHEPNIIAAPEFCPNEKRKSMTSLETLSQPVGQFRLAVLRQVVNALLAEIDAADGGVLRGSAADALDDNGGIRLENDAVVDNLVDGERDEVVVFDNGALVDRLPRVEVSIAEKAWCKEDKRRT